MSQEVTISSLKTLFRFPFSGPKWRNQFLIGSGLLLASNIIPIIPALFVYGYGVQIMRRAIQGEELSLPAWDEWGKLALDGLRLLAISVVYMLPGILVGMAGFVAYLFSFLSIPLFAGAQGGNSGGAVLVTLVAMGILFLATFISMLLVGLGAIPWPLATAHFVAQGKVGAAFRVREWWPLLKRDKLGYFVAWVVMAGLVGVFYMAIIMAYYTLVLCALIPFLAAPIGFYLMVVGAALFGQFYRENAQPAASVVTNDAG